EIGEVEAHHEERYKKILARLENGTLYKREKPIEWKCSKCGYVHVGTEPPEKCPSCHHERGYYWPKNESDL
ncbi:MAG: rubrerythrin family protein, partial [Candidatus Micrarchaeota archaeon]